MNPGWVHESHCGHTCCAIQTNPQHSHVHLPYACGDCQRANEVKR